MRKELRLRRALLGIGILGAMAFLACWLLNRTTEPRVTALAARGEASIKDESTFDQPKVLDPVKDCSCPSVNDEVSKQEDAALVSTKGAGPETASGEGTVTAQDLIGDELPNDLGEISRPFGITVKHGPLTLKSWKEADGVQVHLPARLEADVPQIELRFFKRNIDGEKEPFRVGIVNIIAQGERWLNNLWVGGIGLRLAVGSDENGGLMLRVGDTYIVRNVPISRSFVVPDISEGTVHQISLIVKDLEREASEQKLKEALDAEKRDISIQILDQRPKSPDIEPYVIVYANNQSWEVEHAYIGRDTPSIEGVFLGGELAIHSLYADHLWCYIRSLDATSVIFPGEGQLIVDPQALRKVTFELEEPKQFEDIRALALFFDANARLPLFWKLIERQDEAVKTSVEILALPGEYDLRGALGDASGTYIPLGKIRITDSENRIALPQKHECG